MTNLFSSIQQHFSFPIYSQENNLGVLAFEGADSSRFLQGQITADLNKLTDENALTGAVCNLKGQVITNFYLVKVEDSILMIMQRDLLDKTRLHLKKFAVFFKTTLSDVSDHYQLENHFFSPASELTFTEQENKAVLRDQTRYFIQISQSPIQHLLCITPQSEQENEPLDNDVSTEALSLLAVEPLITLANSEQFLPQMLNMQFTNGISFKKGCYTGQEIVARVQYRGKTKKRLYIGSINNTLNEKAITITNSDGKSVGDIVQQTKLNSTTFILAVINISDSESPLLISDETLTLHDLPYDLL